jgi:hypothetical protein
MIRKIIILCLIVRFLEWGRQEESSYLITLRQLQMLFTVSNEVNYCSNGDLVRIWKTAAGANSRTLSRDMGQVARNPRNVYLLPNVITEWAALLLCILEVMGSTWIPKPTTFIESLVFSQISFLTSLPIH